MIVVSFFAPRFEKYQSVDYDELLLLLDKSCKKLDLKHLVISDSLRPKPLETFLTKLPENLMQAFLYGQLKVLDEYEKPILFTGADCLLTKHPYECFKGSLTITTSDKFTDCKMNAGAIFCNRPILCRKIWKETLELNPKEWGEDQIFLYKTIQKSNEDIRELRCEDHNWAPRDLEDNAGFPTIVHFRGKRKSFMKEWANKYLRIN